MSMNGENSSIAGFDASDHQPAYIFRPSTIDDAPERSAKRRKVHKVTGTDPQETVQAFTFEPLLNGLENTECVRLREELFKRHWAKTEESIQSILGKSNEDTLVKVTSFVQDTTAISGSGSVPAGFIVTGPNIASQGLLFEQLSERLKLEINGPVITLRSGGASNLKASLKQIIRDATNQKVTDEDEGSSFEKDGRKLLNYDLEILHGYIKAHGSNKAIIAFQDSEAFDPSLLGELIALFSSWMDRIPFVLLFGIATSVELFHERLSQSANRCLSGAQFDVEQTSSILEDVFLKVVAGSKAPIRLGPVLVSSLMDRQHNHVQSIQAFISTLKYAYMCHFYANPLSLLGDDQRDSKSLLKLLQPEHLEALRILPSFTKLVETLLEGNEVIHARRLLEDDQVLLSEVEKALDSTSQTITTLLRTMHVLSSATAGPVERIELYIKAFRGTLNDSDTVRAVLDSVKRMTPDALLAFVERIIEAVKYGSPELGLEGWASAEAGTFEKIAHIRTQVTIIAEKSAEIGKPVRSQYAIQSQGLRTTVVAQKVQLSYEKSTLSKLDVQYTNLIDQASKFFGDYFTFEEPHDLFLNEVWLYDSLSPYTDAFTPRPRFAIEQSLSTPYDYLPSCKDTGDALSSANPATAILYQMYLESGSLVNISDIWTAFFSIVGGEDSEGYDERTALMLFYRGLADLRLLGMVKQSKKKVDHLSKSAWKGL